MRPNPVAALSTFIIEHGDQSLNEENGRSAAAELGLGRRHHAPASGSPARSALTYVDHDVETTIGPTAQMSSSGALRIGSDITRVQADVGVGRGDQASSSSPDYVSVADRGRASTTTRPRPPSTAVPSSTPAVPSAVESTVSYPILLLNPCSRSTPSTICPRFAWQHRSASRGRKRWDPRLLHQSLQHVCRWQPAITPGQRAVRSPTTSTQTTPRPRSNPAPW